MSPSSLTYLLFGDFLSLGAEPGDHVYSENRSFVVTYVPEEGKTVGVGMTLISS